MVSNVELLNKQRVSTGARAHLRRSASFNSNYEDINGKPSRYKRFLSGPDRSLSLPAQNNLALFAMTSITDKRVPDPGGFHFQNKLYVPYRKDIQIYEALGNAYQEYTQSQTKIPVKLVEIGEYQMVFFSLDNQMSWEFAIEKGTDTLTSQRHARIIQQVEDMIGKKGHEAAALCKALLESADEPLILNGLHRQPTFQSLSSAREEVEAAARDPKYYGMPVDLSEKLDASASSEEQAALTASAPTAPNARQPTRHKRKSNSATQSAEPAESHPVSSNEVSTGPAIPDDTEEFLRRLREELE